MDDVRGDGIFQKVQAELHGGAETVAILHRFVQLFDVARRLVSSATP